MDTQPAPFSLRLDLDTEPDESPVADDPDSPYQHRGRSPSPVCSPPPLERGDDLGPRRLVFPPTPPRVFRGLHGLGDDDVELDAVVTKPSPPPKKVTSAPTPASLSTDFLYNTDELTPPPAPVRKRSRDTPACPERPAKRSKPLAKIVADTVSFMLCNRGAQPTTIVELHDWLGIERVAAQQCVSDLIEKQRLEVAFDFKATGDKQLLLYAPAEQLFMRPYTQSTALEMARDALVSDLSLSGWTRDKSRTVL